MDWNYTWISTGFNIVTTLIWCLFGWSFFLIINHVDIASYADDNTPCIIADNIDDLFKSLEEASTALFQWFDNNLFKNNPDKCHLLISSNENKTVHVGEYEMKNSKCE